MKVPKSSPLRLLGGRDEPSSPASMYKGEVEGRGNKKNVVEINNHRGDKDLPYHKEEFDFIDIHRALLDDTFEEVIVKIEMAKVKRTSPLAVQGALMHRNENTETPLHVAVYQASPRLVVRLLEAMPVDLLQKVLQSRDCAGNTPLHLACANNQDSDFEVIKNLLLYLPEALELSNDQLDTPLHLLVASPSFSKFNVNIDKEVAAEEALVSMLSVAPHLARVPNLSGLTLLHVGLACGAYERVLVQLLKHAPEVASSRDENGMLPLHYAAAYTTNVPWTFVSQLMYLSTDPELAVNCHGDTPLHTLVANARKRVKSNKFVDRNTIKIVELLMGSATPENEAQSPLLIRNKDDLTPLHCCATSNTPPQITRMLMQSPFAEVASGMMTQYGSTPLHLACAMDKVEDENIVALATRHACTTRDSDNYIPLMVAAVNVNISSSAVKLLCSKEIKSTMATQDDDRVALHLALMTPKAKESVIKQLVKANPDSVTNADKKGNTALHLACRYKWSSDIIKCMLERNPEARLFRNHKNQSPLDMAKHASKKTRGMLDGSIKVSRKTGATSRRTRTVHMSSLVSV